MSQSPRLPVVVTAAPVTAAAVTAAMLTALLLSPASYAQGAQPAVPAQQSTLAPVPVPAPPENMTPVAAPTAVIPELGAAGDESAAAAPTPATTSGPLRTTPNPTTADVNGANSPDTASVAPKVPPLTLKGGWMGFEIIVFERPGVGLTPGGEVLRIDPAPVLPPIGNGMAIGLDPAGSRGTVGYAPVGEPDGLCGLLPAGVAANPQDPLTLLFATPPRAETLAALAPAPTQTALPTGPQNAPQTQPQAEPKPGPDAAPAANQVPGPLADTAPDPEAEILSALAAYETQLVDQQLRWLDPAALRLGAAAARLDGAGDTRVLLHRGWIQQLATRNAPAVLLATDPPQGAPGNPDGLAPELAGTVRVYRSRGLRVAVQLWLRGRDMPPDMPGYIVFSDERRIGTATYYLDHPRLGVILRSTEVGIPADLQAAWTALKAPSPAPAAAAAEPTAYPPP